MHEAALASALSLRIDDARRASLTLDSRRLGTARLSDQADAITMVLVAPLPELAGLALHDGPVQLSWNMPDGSQRCEACSVETLGRDAVADPDLVPLMRAVAAAGVIDPRAAALLSPDCRWREASECPDIAIDLCVETTGGLLVDGWVENVGRRDIALISDDLSLLATVDSFLPRDRPDVARHLDGVAFGRPEPVNHGFTAALIGPVRAGSGVFLVERSPAGMQATGPLAVQRQGGRAAALGFALARLDRAQEVNAAVIERFVKPFAAVPAHPAQVAVERHGSAPSDCALSLIVPLSGDILFLKLLLAADLASLESLEWLLVVERRHAQAIRTCLGSIAPELDVPVALVVCDGEDRPAALLNAATAAARGRVLAFLDESTWLDDAAILQLGLQALGRVSPALVALRMSREDGRQDEMALQLRRDPLWRGVWHLSGQAEGNGATADSGAIGIARARLLQWRGLMIDRALFNEAGGFDDGYLSDRGFDADLCLRLGGSATEDRLTVIRAAGASHGSHSFSRMPADMTRARRACDAMRLAARFPAEAGS